MVRHNRKMVFAAGYGFANLEHNVPVTPQKTVFQSGSVGKQFTAMAVMILIEEKKLDLDDPISKYLDVPNAWSAITVNTCSRTRPGWAITRKNSRCNRFLGRRSTQHDQGPAARLRARRKMGLQQSRLFR